MEYRNAHQPAHPLTVINQTHSVTGAPVNCDVYTGITKRELFAAMAMQGILSNSFVADAMNGEGEGDQHAKDIATASILTADALLEALK